MQSRNQNEGLVRKKKEEQKGRKKEKKKKRKNKRKTNGNRGMGRQVVAAGERNRVVSARVDPRMQKRPAKGDGMNGGIEWIHTESRDE